jgi:hypothetical protein
MENAEVADFHEAVRQDMLEEATDKFDDVEVGGTKAGTADCPGGENDRAVRKRDKAAVGDGDREDIRGEGGEGGVALVVCLTVDMPGDGPDLGSDVCQQAGMLHGFFEERAGNRREGFDGDKEERAGGAPGRAVLGEAARDNGVHGGVVLQLLTPRMEDPGEPREVSADEARVVGQPFQGGGRRLKQGLVREALVRAAEGAERLRDGAGEEEVRSGQLLLQMMCEPLRGFLLLTLGTMAVATGMMHTVLAPTVWTLREAVAVVATLAVLDGTDDLAVGEGQLRGALQVFWSKGSADLTEGRHDRSLPS